MTWVTPLYAGIAAAIAVPSLIILYFLKLRRRDLEISTTLLWRKAIQDLQANAPFQKLRRNLLLFLQLLVLAGIIIALGQPQVRGQTITGNKHVILIDRSGSMASIDEVNEGGKPVSRLAAAKKQALAFVDSLSEGNILNKSTSDETMVIAFGSSAEVRQQFTSDKAALRRAIEAIDQMDGPTSIEDAVALAIAHKPRRLVEQVGMVNGPPITIELYSDGRLPDALKAVPAPNDAVIYHRMGKPESINLGIVGLRAERDYDDPNKLSVYVSVQSSAAQERTVDLELAVDGQVAGIRSLTVPGATQGARLSAPAAAQADAREREAGTSPTASETEAMTQQARPGVSGDNFRMDRGEGALVQVRLLSPGSALPVEGDVLATDDTAWLVVPPAKKLAVALVGRSDMFIASALSGLPLSKLDTKTPAEFEEMERQDKLSEYDVYLCNGWAPGVAVSGAEAKPTAHLPAGRYIILGAIPPNSGMVDKGKAGSAAVVDWNRDHPVLRSTNLGTINIATSRPIEIIKGAGVDVMATADNGPFIVEYRSTDARAIVVPFDTLESDWSFKPSFVVFLASAINYLGEDGVHGMGRIVTPGGELSDRVPSGAKDVTVKGPDGVSHPLVASGDGRIVFGPIASSGVYDVTWEGAPGPTDIVNLKGRALREYAANLLDEKESDVAAATTVSLATGNVQAEGGKASLADKKLWPWFLLGALGIVMLEWFIYNKKVYL